MAGGINLWETRKLRFWGGLLRISMAVDGAVVSNPIAKKTKSLSGSFSAILTASPTPYTILTSPPEAFAS